MEDANCINGKGFKIRFIFLHIAVWDLFSWLYIERPTHTFSHKYTNHSFFDYLPYFRSYNFVRTDFRSFISRIFPPLWFGLSGVSPRQSNLGSLLSGRHDLHPSSHYLAKVGSLIHKFLKLFMGLLFGFSASSVAVVTSAYPFICLPRCHLPLIHRRKESRIQQLKLSWSIITRRG